MNSKYYQEYFVLEREHWWFKARMKILETQVRKVIENQNGSGLKILNVGVATGATSQMLSKFGSVTSVEYDSDCCKFLRENLKMEVKEASFTDLPFGSGEYDLVCAFDVIEHIKDDERAVSEAQRVLKKKGNFIFTVPAYNFLWSSHDVINHHYRRYTKSSFDTLLKSSEKLELSFSSYFNFWLFLPIASFRAFNKLQKKSDDVKSDFEKFKGNNLTNRLLYSLFLTENALLKHWISFPFGVSYLTFGKKL